MTVRELDLVDDERVRIGVGDKEGGLGFTLVGLVPERLRKESGGDDTLVVIIAGGCVKLRSCAADAEGLNIRRGVLVPLAVFDARAVISSPLAEGPAPEKVDPF